LALTIRTKTSFSVTVDQHLQPFEIDPATWMGEAPGFSRLGEVTPTTLLGTSTLYVLQLHEDSRCSHKIIGR